jgi:hypothetical protein
MFMIRYTYFLSYLLLASCVAGPQAGPDKQGYGLVSGALIGGASGVITGAQLGVATGPGAFIGAGLGGLWGSLKGLGLDILEEEDLRLLETLSENEDDVWAQYAFLEHLERKNDLFPSRDIFPADSFFKGDTVDLSQEGEILTKYLARKVFCQNSHSRIQITTYIQTKDSASPFTKHITKKRSEALALALSLNGIEPRRVVIQTVSISSPLVDDKYDSYHRYSQAVEFALVDI